MADNVTADAGTGGATFATDDIAGIHYPRSKIALGADGAATDAVGGAGAVSAAVIRATLASDDPAVVSLQILDNAIAGTEMQVDVVAALPAGTNNIGDVDVLTVPADPFGANADAASATGSISAKLRFIASTGIPVTGTVTVGSHAVTNAGTFATQVDGAALTALQVIDNPVIVDDAAFTPATTSVMMAGFTFDDVAPDSVNEGDAGAARMSANRNIYTTIRDAAGNERGLNIDASGQLAVTLASAQTLATVTTVGTVTTVSTLTGGAVAHDSADSGNPIKVGAKASATLSDDTMVANADRTDLTSDLDGALLVRPQFPLGDLISENVSNTNGTSTAFTNFGAVASTRSYITAYSIFRTDAGTTPIYVDFRDGTAGAILWSVVLPPNGGANMASATPLFRTTANTALAFDVSAATTTVYINVSGFKSKV